MERINIQCGDKIDRKELYERINKDARLKNKDRRKSFFLKFSVSKNYFLFLNFYFKMR